MKDKGSMALTVVMPVYREEEKHLRLAVESILNQTWQEFQFIIILDDPCNCLLKNVINDYAERDNRIILYVNEKNLGCPRSKDRGIKLAKTEYVAIMDADDIAGQCRFEKQMHKILEKKLDLVAGCVRVINDKGAPLYYMDKLPLEHVDIAKKLRVNNCMPHPTWILRKDMYINLGGYADIQGCEDYDFLIRAIRGGYKLGTVGDIVLDYRLSAKSVSRNNLYKQYLMMRYLQDKYYFHKYNYKNYEGFYKQKYSEIKAKKYARASIYFVKALAYKSNKNYFGMLISMFKVLISSKEYCMKILRYIMQNQ